MAKDGAVQIAGQSWFLLLHGTLRSVLSVQCGACRDPGALTGLTDITTEHATELLVFVPRVHGLLAEVIPKLQLNSDDEVDWSNHLLDRYTRRCLPSPPSH